MRVILSIPAGALAAAIASLAFASASLIPLGELAGGDLFSRANALSPDGEIIVGQSSSGVEGESIEAFRWTAATGIVPLGDITGGRFESIATGVSTGGAVVAGRGHTGVTRAITWTHGGLPVALPELPGGGIGGATAAAVTPDGTVIVGTDSAENGVEAFRYEGGAILGLGDLDGGIFRSDAEGVSHDGSIVVGSSRSGDGTQAFRWTATTGMVGLGDLPGGTYLSIAYAISGDGAVIAGHGRSETGETASRWTEATGMLPLHVPARDETSRALGVNADGTVIVGRRVHPDGTQEAFVWTANHGMRALADILADAGVNVAGWTLRYASAVSADGRVVVGFGTNPSGWTEAFRATIPAPCPADLDTSGGVGFADLLAMLASWGPCPGCVGDLTGDGDVTFDDLLLMLANWGRCPE